MPLKNVLYTPCQRKYDIPQILSITVVSRLPLVMVVYSVPFLVGMRTL